MYCGALIQRVQDSIYCISLLDLESEMTEGISIRQRIPEENPGSASSVPAFSRQQMEGSPFSHGRRYGFHRADSTKQSCGCKIRIFFQSHMVSSVL